MAAGLAAMDARVKASETDDRSETHGRIAVLISRYLESRTSFGPQLPGLHNLRQAGAQTS